jgi:hypothetical protein
MTMIRKKKRRKRWTRSEKLGYPKQSHEEDVNRYRNDNRKISVSRGQRDPRWKSRYVENRLNIKGEKRYGTVVYVEGRKKAPVFKLTLTNRLKRMEIYSLKSIKDKADVSLKRKKWNRKRIINRNLGYDRRRVTNCYGLGDDRWYIDETRKGRYKEEVDMRIARVSRPYELKGKYKKSRDKEENRKRKTRLRTYTDYTISEDGRQRPPKKNWLALPDSGRKKRDNGYKERSRKARWVIEKRRNIDIRKKRVKGKKWKRNRPDEKIQKKKWIKAIRSSAKKRRGIEVEKRVKTETGRTWSRGGLFKRRAWKADKDHGNSRKVGNWNRKGDNRDQHRSGQVAMWYRIEGWKNIEEKDTWYVCRSDNEERIRYGREGYEKLRLKGGIDLEN